MKTLLPVLFLVFVAGACMTTEERSAHRSARCVEAGGTGRWMVNGGGNPMITCELIGGMSVEVVDPARWRGSVQTNVEAKPRAEREAP